MKLGETLGPYRVVEKLCAGGMGEVYRARDTRLDRTVAIKVLPPDISGDPERRARLERKARAVAAMIPEETAEVWHSQSGDERQPGLSRHQTTPDMGVMPRRQTSGFNG